MTNIGPMLQGCKIENDNFPPTASFTVSPYSGATETIFVFDASESADLEDQANQLLISWDFMAMAFGIRIGLLINVIISGLLMKILTFVAMGRMLSYQEDEVYRLESFFKTVGASVRCVKD